MLSAIEAACREIIQQRVPESDLRQAMLYSLQAGGKRLRPYLYLLHRQAFGELQQPDYRLAAALELIHTYSLIHDDLPAMDDDDLRRGQPTNHKVYGEALAILAGDALLNTALEELLAIGLEHPEYLEAGLIIARAAGASGMIYGQVLDMAAQATDLAELRQVADLKTGALIGAAIDAAAAVSGLDHRDRIIFKQVARDLGFVFQVRDDILDVESSSDVLGKTVGKDEAQHKVTAVSLLGLADAKKLEDYLIAQIKASLDQVETVDVGPITAYYDSLYSRKK